MKKYLFTIIFLSLINFSFIEAADSFKIIIKPNNTKASVTVSCITCTFGDSKYNGTVSVSDSVISGGYFQMRNVFFDQTKPVTVEFDNLKKDVSYKVLASANGIPSTTTTFKINTPKPTNNTPVTKTDLQKAQEAYDKAKAEYDKNPTAQNSAYLNNASKNLDEAKKKAGVTPENDPPVKLPKNEEVRPSDNTTYNLLAPLPGLKSIQTNDIGKYFNIIFNIAIGICGVLAVIMLIIHGVSYMTSESFTEKAELKKKIWGPIGGLLLALGAYAILNTIDPALTGKEGLSVDQVSVDVPEDNNYTPAQAQKIINDAITSKSIVVGYAAGNSLVNGTLNKTVKAFESKSASKPIKAIVMHGTAGATTESAFATWVNHDTDNDPKNNSSAHFIIDQDGTVWQTVGIDKRANHFIPNDRGNTLGINNGNTIGIEITQKCKKTGPNTCVWDAPTSKQISSGASLVKGLLTKFSLKSTDLYGHGQIGQHRTPDEGLAEIAGIMPYIK